MKNTWPLRHRKSGSESLKFECFGIYGKFPQRSYHSIDLEINSYLHVAVSNDKSRFVIQEKKVFKMNNHGWHATLNYDRREGSIHEFRNHIFHSQEFTNDEIRFHEFTNGFFRFSRTNIVMNVSVSRRHGSYSRHYNYK